MEKLQGKVKMNWGILLLILVTGLIYLLGIVPACKQIPIEELVEKDGNVTIKTSEIDLNILKKALDKSSYILINSVGESMLPTIKSNSECLCGKKEFYSVNDIVVYYNGRMGNLVGHRIIGETDNGDFILKGDNNSFSEGPIDEEDILCKIPLIERWKLLKFK